MFVANNRIVTMVTYLRKGLREVYDDREVENIIAILFEHARGWDRITLKINLDQNLSESELLRMHWKLKRLKKNEPIQYVLGEAPFFGLTLKVNRDVLIPRPETEELVQLIVNRAPKNAWLIDIGTGSGCIALALKSARKDLLVKAVDVDPAALSVAKKNAERLDLEVNFEQLNILSESLVGKYDVIVSNPPYIPNNERVLMDKNVVEFEPEIALFVPDDDPLIFYRRIVKLAQITLQVNGQLFFEIHESLGNEVRDLLESCNFKQVEILNDINGKPRMAYAKI